MGPRFQISIIWETLGNFGKDERHVGGFCGLIPAMMRLASFWWRERLSVYRLLDMCLLLWVRILR